MSEDRKGDSIFEMRLGPAFFAVVIQMIFSVVAFSYMYGQQVNSNENTKEVTNQLRTITQRQNDRQDNMRERLIKVETIISTVESSIRLIDAKLDRINLPAKVDKQ